jgi:hypothetical protein
VVLSLLVQAVGGGVSFAFRRNGAADGSGSGPNWFTGGYALQLGAGAPSEDLVQADVAELRIYGRLVSSSQARAVEDELAAIYGITF